MNKNSKKTNKKETIRLYKYISDDYCLDVIEHSKLHLYNSDYCNDPFELFDGSNYCFDDNLLLSLTNSNRQKRMWSFYANSHKGVCFQIEIDKDNVSPIIYTSKRINVAESYDSFIKDKCISSKNKRYQFLEKHKDKYWCFVKDKKWQDEKEYRCLFEKNSEGVTHKTIKGKLHYFVHVKITAVYLGCKISDKLKKDIIDVAREKNIKVREMIMYKDNYSVGPKPKNSNN